MKNLMDRLWCMVGPALFVFTFIAFLITGGAVTIPRYRQISGLEASRQEISRNINAKKQEIEAIKAKQRRFNTDREFVETLARQNRRVFPGDLVFVFDD